MQREKQLELNKTKQHFFHFLLTFQSSPSTSLSNCSFSCFVWICVSPRIDSSSSLCSTKSSCSCSRFCSLWRSCEFLPSMFSITSRHLHTKDQYHWGWNCYVNTSAHRQITYLLTNHQARKIQCVFHCVISILLILSLRPSMTCPCSHLGGHVWNYWRCVLHE